MAEKAGIVMSGSVRCCEVWLDAVCMTYMLAAGVLQIRQLQCSNQASPWLQQVSRTTGPVL